MKYCVYCGKQLDGKDCDCKGYKAHNRANKNLPEPNDTPNKISNKRKKGGFSVLILLAVIAVAVGFFQYHQSSIVGAWNGHGRSTIHDVQFGKDGTFYNGKTPYGKYSFKDGVLNIDMVIAKEVYYVKFSDKNNMELYTDKAQQNLFETFERKGTAAAESTPNVKVETTKAVASTPSTTTEPSSTTIASTTATANTKKTWQETYLDFLNGPNERNINGYSLFDFTGNGVDNLIVYTKDQDFKIYGTDASGNIQEITGDTALSEYFAVSDLRDQFSLFQMGKDKYKNCLIVYGGGGSGGRSWDYIAMENGVYYTNTIYGYARYNNGTENTYDYYISSAPRKIGHTIEATKQEYTDILENEIGDWLPVYKMNSGKIARLCDAKDLVKMEPSASASTVSQDYILPNSNTAYLSRELLENLPLESLALARNEIYARHGFVFKTEKYSTYFSAKSWYKPNPDYKGGEETLNEFERANVQIIQALEK